VSTDWLICRRFDATTPAVQQAVQQRDSRVIPVVGVAIPIDATPLVPDSHTIIIGICVPFPTIGPHIASIYCSAIGAL